MCTDSVQCADLSQFTYSYLVEVIVTIHLQRLLRQYPGGYRSCVLPMICLAYIWP